MSWNVIRLADVEEVPWRNGGGITRELALGPAPDAWNWRMSVAEVVTNGPFSRFEGVERWFAVLRGAGVVLTMPPPAHEVDSVPLVHRVTCNDPPLVFDGAAHTQCQLLNGPTQDFNLMVRDSCLPARMVRVNGAVQEMVGANKIVAIYAVGSAADVRFNNEELRVSPATLVWRSVAESGTIHIQSDHALWLELSV